MEIRKDILGNIPKIGDLIVYNPPRVKGLTIAKVFGFAKSGLPRVIDIEDLVEVEEQKVEEQITSYDYFCDTPKTGFAIVQSNNYEIY